MTGHRLELNDLAPADIGAFVELWRYEYPWVGHHGERMCVRRVAFRHEHEAAAFARELPVRDGDEIVVHHGPFGGIA